MRLVSKIKSALMTKVNSPRVKIVIGRVRMSKIGLRIALIIPRTSAVISAALKSAT